MADNVDTTNNNRWKNRMGWCGFPGAVYGLGFIGSLVYYIQTSPTFLDGVIGFFKAIVWPAILIYKVFQFFKL